MLNSHKHALTLETVERVIRLTAGGRKGKAA